MAYEADMPRAARRHLLAADDLLKTSRQDVAGYLYGIAAECAVKAMMQSAGISSTSTEDSKKNPYYVHFPELRAMLRDKISGRSGAVLNRFIQDDAFMNNWSIKMRYSHGREIHANWVARWSEQARQVVESIGT